MILVGGSDALAQNKKKSKKGKKDQASTFVEGRQKVRESDYATFDKFTTFSSKSTTLYYSPFDYFDFFELCADDNPDWGEDIKPVMNYMVKNTRATMTLCPLFAINPDITDRTQRQELIEKAKNEAQAAIDAFEGWKNRKGMRNKTQYKIAELDYRYFKGTNYYNQQRSDDIIRVGVLLYFGSKKNAIFVPDTASSHTFPDIKFFPNDATIVESWVPVLDELAEYINANAPMSNLPELLDLHHSNPLGLHPIAIPIFLLVAAVAMHLTTNRIYHQDKRSLYPLLYTLVALAVVATYYYCFSGDLPLFEDWDLHRKEISVGWFCQKNIQPQAHRHGKAPDGLAAFAVPCPVILGSKGQRGLRESVHQAVGDKIEVLGGGHAGDAVRPETVDRRLDHDIGEGEHHSLKPCRHSDIHHFSQIFPPDCQFPEIQPELVFLVRQKVQNQPAADIVGNHGRQRDTRHRHLQPDHKQKIQKDVQNARKGQRAERPSAVAAAAQDRRAEIVGHHGRHAAEIDPEI